MRGCNALNDWEVRVSRTLAEDLGRGSSQWSSNKGTTWLSWASWWPSRFHPRHPPSSPSIVSADPHNTSICPTTPAPQSPTLLNCHFERWEYALLLHYSNVDLKEQLKGVSNARTKLCLVWISYAKVILDQIVIGSEPKINMSPACCEGGEHSHTWWVFAHCDISGCWF
jgi:hypothetical protein